MTPKRRSPILHRGAALGLFFVSGFTGLVYQVMWMRELGLLFGNTAHATATTLAAFFLGLAVGGYVWGKRVSSSSNALLTYALLEAAVAVSALLFFILQMTYHAIYAPLFEILGQHRVTFIMVKFLLAMVVLFPPAFFMGGTLPVISQHLVRHAGTLGVTVSRAYGVNTFGAALGAYAAGFHFPVLLGFTRTYLVAITLTAIVAAIAWRLGKSIPLTATPSHPLANPAPGPVRSASGLYPVRLLVFLSGFVTLSLEVLWTRMFAQVLQNSVYTFSAILVTVLCCLALGALLAAWLAQRVGHSSRVLFALLNAAALLVVSTPYVFVKVTEGLSYTGADLGWVGYLMDVFGTMAMVIVVPGIILGTLFPYLIKVSEPFSHSAGRTVGDLVAINTAGAIMGALCAGFLLLEVFGLWNSIFMMAALYLLAALFVKFDKQVRPLIIHTAVVAGLLVVAGLGLATSSGLPRVKINDIHAQERILEIWEGSAATVAVVEQQRGFKPNDESDTAGQHTERRTSLRIKVNNYYSLGGTDSRKWEAWQSHLPLLLHPEPRSVFYLGMGTGITAGAALQHSVERVVITEIVPEAIEAARKYFTPYLNDLFDDPRALVLVEDGRNYLLGTREQFDVIIADLFMPWKAGTGNLYTIEHYDAVRARLTEQGLFAQWLPLYQMSYQEFSTIARTMLEIFPMVTLWRGDFFYEGPAVVLIGHQSPVPLDPRALQNRLAQARPVGVGDTPLLHFVPDALELVQRRPADTARFLLYYAGNLTAAHELLDRFPLNTDDYPIIEYRAPITQRRQQAQQTMWFVGAELLDFFDDLINASPPDRDPYLQAFNGREQNFVNAGLSLYSLQVLESGDDQEGAQKALRNFATIVFGGALR